MEKLGWGYTNAMIADLAEEEKERFYQEDITVDPKQGLQWRVKSKNKNA